MQPLSAAALILSSWYFAYRVCADEARAIVAKWRQLASISVC
jgi:hypothetical protein